MQKLFIMSLLLCGLAGCNTFEDLDSIALVDGTSDTAVDSPSDSLPDTEDCSADLNTDPENCGGCGVLCDIATENCTGGMCACKDGLADCDGDGSCETDIVSDPANCGGCAESDSDRACREGEVCGDGRCTSISAIALGNDHTCVALSTGPVMCWGSNEDNQMPGVPRGAIQEPTQVPLELPEGVFFVDLASGGVHTCGIGSNDRVYCWGGGDTRDLQLGHNAVDGSFGRVPFTNFGTPVDLAVGRNHACALDSDGVVACWGSNDDNQLTALGLMPPEGPYAPTRFTQGIDHIAAGSLHTCAYTSMAGRVRCWGQNMDGQLGHMDPDDDFITNPILTAQINDASLQLSGGLFHGCANTGSSIVCWSDPLADGPYVGPEFGVPMLPPTSLEWSALATGRTHNCAIAQSGSDVGTAVIHCWGFNTARQLGNGNTTPSNIPLQVDAAIPDPVRIATGGQHSCAVTRNAEVWCWGANDLAQVSGDLPDGPVVSPVPVISRQ